MAETMIERVARAMEPILFGGLPDGECGPATPVREAVGRVYVSMIDAALKETN